MTDHELPSAAASQQPRGRTRRRDHRHGVQRWYSCPCLPRIFGRRHKVIFASYLYGLTAFLLLTLLGSGTKLTMDQRRRYNRIMGTIDLQVEYNAANTYHHAYNNYYHAKGWISCYAHCQVSVKNGPPFLLRADTPSSFFLIS